MSKDVKVVDEHFAIIEIDKVQHNLVDEIDDIVTCNGCAFSYIDSGGYHQCSMPNIGKLASACGHQNAIWRPMIAPPQDQQEFSINEVLNALADMNIIPSTMTVSVDNIKNSYQQAT